MFTYLPCSPPPPPPPARKPKVGHITPSRAKTTSGICHSGIPGSFTFIFTSPLFQRNKVTWVTNCESDRTCVLTNESIALGPDMTMTFARVDKTLVSSKFNSAEVYKRRGTDWVHRGDSATPRTRSARRACFYQIQPLHRGKPVARGPSG